MKKHHAGGLFLKMKEIQTAAYFSVIVFGKHCRRSFGIGAETPGRRRQAAAPCRFSAGLASSGGYLDVELMRRRNRARRSGSSSSS
ncbi:MAG TPA: hypothetical protein VHB79_18775 [Polyangiaceae bacterium]|nr:hypothetical protein [Polyangiaceae bacterium]